MKKTSKLILFILTISLLVCLTVFAASAQTYSGKCGDDLTWSLNTSTGVLDISGNGEMKNYSNYYNAPNAPWDFYSNYVKTVNIGGSVTSIGDWAFRGCSNLTSVTIPDGVTSIGLGTFEDCSSLTSVTIPDSVTSISNYAFRYCSSLTSVTIPDTVTSIGNAAFSCCSSLTSVTIPDSVTSIDDYAFGGCSSLTSVTIPDSVTSIGNAAFSCCSSLTSVTIPDSVTSIDDYAFEYCSSLTSVTIPDSVTSIGERAFDNTAIYNNSDNWVDNVLYIGNHLIKAKTNISGSYIIKDGTKTIADSAFYNCSSLTSVTIPDSVTSIGGWAFNGCSNLTSITIPDSVTSIGSYAFERCSSLTSVTIGESVTSIGSGAFYNCSSLKNITILNSDCKIDSCAIPSNTLIKGYAKSTAHDYATKKGNPFELIDAHEHSYKSKVTKPATCTAKGKKIFTCSCGDSYTKEIKATGHKETILKARTATAKKSGLTEGKKCSVCGKILTAQKMTLAQVTGLKASTVKKDSIKLTWSKIDGAKYYKVEQSTDGKTWKVIKTVDTNTYTVSKLTAGKKYQFRVTALDSTKKISGKASATLKTGTLTAAPTVTVKSTKSKTAVASWKKVTGASKYIVYKSTDGKKWTKVTTTTKLTYTLTKLTGGKKIYVKVVAVNAYGKNSAASAVKNVTVKK